MIERPKTMPAAGEVAPFDAGWLAHELGFDRETVRLLAADPGWALLGYDGRAALAASPAAEETQP